MYRVTEGDLKDYSDLINNGFSQRAACEALGIPRSTMQDTLARLDQPKPKRGLPKIVFVDVETAPSVVVAFGRFNQNFSQDNVLEEGGWLISACWKYAGSHKVHKVCLTPKEIGTRDDSRIVAALFDIIEDSDIIVAQNGDRFDLPVIQTRGLINNMPPFKSVKTVDTLKIARRLKFNSNRLDSLGEQLGLGRKVQHTGIDLWVRCMKGDKNALRDMVEYNEQDVILLEAVYNKLKCYDNKHPNMAHYYDDNTPRCRVCGSTDLTESGHSIFTDVSEFVEVVCNDCNSRSRTRQAINTKDKRKSILAGVR